MPATRRAAIAAALRALADAVELPPDDEPIAAPTGEPAALSLLDRAGLAEALKCSVSTVDRLVARGAPSVPLLGDRRFRFDAVVAWLSEPEETPRSLPPRRAPRVLPAARR